MKKYFATSIIAATILSVSLLSCKKDVTGTNTANKATSATDASDLGKTRIVTQDDSVFVKK